MSQFDKLMAILSDVHERPESRDDFRRALYLLHENNRESYDKTMSEIKTIIPALHKELADFIFNINDVKDFIKSAEA